MSAATWNTTVEQGATWTRVLTVRDAAGALLNLTGYTSKMQARNRADALKIDLSNVSGMTLGGAAGTITVTITAATTAALVVEPLTFDMTITSAAGVVTRLVQGRMSVDDSVTV